MAKKEDKSPAALRPGEERALLKACWRSEAEAWDRFLEQYSRLIYFSIHRTVALKHYRTTPEEVEDLFHDLLVHLIKDDCKKLRLYRGDSGCTVATWLRTITVRFVIDYLRQRAREGSKVEIEMEEVQLEVSLANPVTRPDQFFQEQEEDRRVEAALLELTKNDRYFMELYYKKGKRPEEVAILLGLSVKTVYSRVSRLREKIQENLNQAGRK